MNDGCVQNGVGVGAIPAAVRGCGTITGRAAVAARAAGLVMSGWWETTMHGANSSALHFHIAEKLSYVKG
jgi:hypothetical protein